jgi:hypothetical protein
MWREPGHEWASWRLTTQSQRPIWDSSGMWRRELWYKFTDVSEEHTASIFVIEARKERRNKLYSLRASCWLLFDREDGVSTFLRNVG